MNAATRAACLALVERVLAAQGDAAEPALVALQHTLTAPDLSEEVALCLEHCRRELEHYDETAMQIGTWGARKRLPVCADYATATLARYHAGSAHQTPEYWKRVETHFAAYVKPLPEPFTR
jgi:hypothetical protein